MNINEYRVYKLKPLVKFNSEILTSLFTCLNFMTMNRHYLSELENFNLLRK